MNRIEIKLKAKEIMKDNFKDFWKGYGIILVINIVISIVLNILLNDGILKSTLNLVSSLFLSTLSVGFYVYILKMIRNEDYDTNDIFAFVSQVLPIVTISLLTVIFTFLWGLLFVIPGIIAALSYSMAFFLYADNQDKLPMEYLTDSKKMMQGYKMDYFIFQLSFIGWILLSLITFGIALIYVIPYISISEAIYYDELKQISEKE